MPKKSSRGLSFFLKQYFYLVLVASFAFVGAGFVLHTLASHQFDCANSASCTSDLSEHIDNTALGIFEGKKVVPPKIDSNFLAQNAVLGTTTPTGTKHIFVDLSTQTLYAYQGSSLFMKVLVSTGRWDPTPPGNYHIWEKLPSTRMAGGEGASAYDLPNVPWVEYFYHDFGLHGAYWHDNFGTTMSHGCVNMTPRDAKTLYGWTDGPQNGQLGTEVSICDSITSTNQCIQNNPVQ